VGVEEVLVVHDELDLPFGKLALKKGGGSGGHNGLNSIAESWGEPDYARLRFGIGKPQGPGAKERVIGHVLGNFSQEEGTALGELVERSVQAIELWAREGLSTAMNRFNKR
jgi:peptidyl-tRNA hydrolase, PTH1 family